MKWLKCSSKHRKPLITARWREVKFKIKWKERLPQWGNPSTLYLDYMEMRSTKAVMRQSEKYAPYWLLIEYYWSQKGVNWLSRSGQNVCRENTLNSNSDWPHGSVDAAFIIAFAWCFSPRFNICRDMQCDSEEKEENSFLVIQMMFVARCSPTETNIRMVLSTSTQTANPLLLVECTHRWL